MWLPHNCDFPLGVSGKQLKKAPFECRGHALQGDSDHCVEHGGAQQLAQPRNVLSFTKAVCIEAKGNGQKAIPGVWLSAGPTCQIDGQMLENHWQLGGGGCAMDFKVTKNGW